MSALATGTDFENSSGRGRFAQVIWILKPNFANSTELTLEKSLTERTWREYGAKLLWMDALPSLGTAPAQAMQATRVPVAWLNYLLFRFAKKEVIELGRASARETLTLRIIVSKLICSPVRLLPNWHIGPASPVNLAEVAHLRRAMRRL